MPQEAVPLEIQASFEIKDERIREHFEVLLNAFLSNPQHASIDKKIQTYLQEHSIEELYQALQKNPQEVFPKSYVQKPECQEFIQIIQSFLDTRNENKELHSYWTELAEDKEDLEISIGKIREALTNIFPESFFSSSIENEDINSLEEEADALFLEYDHKLWQQVEKALFTWLSNSPNKQIILTEYAKNPRQYLVRIICFSFQTENNLGIPEEIIFHLQNIYEKAVEMFSPLFFSGLRLLYQTRILMLANVNDKLLELQEKFSRQEKKLCLLPGERQETEKEKEEISYQVHLEDLGFPEQTDNLAQLGHKIMEFHLETIRKKLSLDEIANIQGLSKPFYIIHFFAFTFFQYQIPLNDEQKAIFLQAIEDYKQALLNWLESSKSLPSRKRILSGEKMKKSPTVLKIELLVTAQNVLAEYKSLSKEDRGIIAKLVRQQAEGWAANIHHISLQELACFFLPSKNLFKQLPPKPEGMDEQEYHYGIKVLTKFFTKLFKKRR